MIQTAPNLTNGKAIIFVSRQIPDMGTVYWDVPKGMPGVGPFSRFQVAAPGKLLVREANGAIRTLVDGGNPTVASLQLVDVNAPDIAYDGETIVFAGLPNGDYDLRPMTNPGAWRLYTIKLDGSSLTQVTTSSQDDLDLSQFGDIAGQFRNYDDTDPRVATRWPHRLFLDPLAIIGHVWRSTHLQSLCDQCRRHRFTPHHVGTQRG